MPFCASGSDPTTQQTNATGVISLASPGPAEPGVLPRDGETLIVSAKPDVGAIVITDLHRLVLAERDGSRDADAGARLTRSGIRHTTQAGNAAEPEISVQRKPEPWLYIVAQVAFKASDRAFPFAAWGLVAKNTAGSSCRTTLRRTNRVSNCPNAWSSQVPV